MRIGSDRKKALRLLCFLLSGLLMMTVSAAIYNYMYLHATISSAMSKVSFANGSDATAAGTSIGTNGTYVTFSSLSGWPNATRVYENATVIGNNDAAIDFACQLARDSWSGSTTSIDELYVRVYNEVGTLQATLDVKAGGTATFTIPHDESWRVEWRIKWSATALSTDAISVALTLRVTGEGTGE